MRNDEAAIVEEPEHKERWSNTSQIKSLWRMLKTKLYNCTVVVGENIIHIVRALTNIFGRRGDFINIE